MDREWYEVHLNGAGLVAPGDPFANEELADEFAAEVAAESTVPVCVVYCRRTEIRSFQRQVTVTATDVASVPALSAEGKA